MSVTVSDCFKDGWLSRTYAATVFYFYLIIARVYCLFITAAFLISATETTASCSDGFVFFTVSLFFILFVV